jgi:hypothetical protein
MFKVAFPEDKSSGRETAGREFACRAAGAGRGMLVTGVGAPRWDAAGGLLVGRGWAVTFV